MITQEEKTDLINALKKIDIKAMSIDNQAPAHQKWFRFGNYNALRIVAEIIKQLPEKIEEKVS